MTEIVTTAHDDRPKRRNGAAPPPLCPSRHTPQSVAACVPRGPAHPLAMGTKSRETIYGTSVRAAAERAAEARKQADRLFVATNFDRRSTEQQKKRLVKRLADLGYAVEIKPLTA
jgi:hypothetical protein